MERPLKMSKLTTDGVEAFTQSFKRKETICPLEGLMVSQENGISTYHAKIGPTYEDALTQRTYEDDVSENKTETKVETCDNPVSGKNSKKPRVRQTQYVKWMFRFTKDKVLRETLETRLRTFEGYIFQEEAGKESGQLHYQGFIHTKKCRKNELQAKFKYWFEELNFPHQDYLEREARDHAVEMYSQKSDTRVAGPWFGGDVKPIRPIEKWTYDMLRPQQKTIVKAFEDKGYAGICERRIFWFWEKKGEWGKTIITKYFYDSSIFRTLPVGGKGADILCAIAKYVQLERCGPDLVIFDIPRCTLEYISYQAMEKIVDGLFFSGKYESACVRMNVPWVICFANSKPAEESLSKDRWCVTELTEKINKK